MKQRKIYDISRELFSAPGYPGDPLPQKEIFCEITEKTPYQLTKIIVGSHNGTHMDAPSHFIKNGKNIDVILLEKCIGKCKVVWHKGLVTKEDMESFLSAGDKRLLIGGEIEITLEAAKVFTNKKGLLIGVEGLTVGPMNAPMEVHLQLLSNEVVIVESLLLKEIKEGSYFLSAAPIKMAKLDGSPVRAWLMDDIDG